MSSAVGGAATRLAGKALAGLFAAVGTARSGRRKALHPRGDVVAGRLRRHGSSPATGSRWLDTAGVDDVKIRWSRSVGLSPRLPDILGMAVRVPLPEGRYGDLLLATTGSGRLSRFLLRPARHYGGRTYSSLFPFRTASGPLLIAAIPSPASSGSFELCWARGTAGWRRFGTLEVAPGQRLDHDPAVSFDPVLNVLPGLDAYRWAADLRRFAYASSRRVRDARLVRSG